MATVSKVKVVAGSWKGQTGEFVREEDNGVIVARMAGDRLVEFAPDSIEPVEDDAADYEAE